MIHLGLHGGSQTYNLECGSYNKANITSPDNRDYKCFNEPICKEIPLDTLYKTRLEMQELYNGLKGCKMMFPVALSYDPGRYLCNYIYFASTLAANKLGIPTLFIHTPDIQEKKIKKSTKDICRIFQEI